MGRLIEGLGAVALLFVLGIYLFVMKGQDYYLVSLMIIGIVLVVFFAKYEKRLRLRELVIIAVMSGVSIVARIALFMVPQAKPTAAFTIITGVALGKEAGFATGVLTMFLSNFYFGQGTYTPFQMLGMGFVGYLCGLIFHNHTEKRIGIIVVGCVATVVIYGLIVDLNTILLVNPVLNREMIFATYGIALPMNLIHGVSTGIFLGILYKPILTKLKRIQVKYGLLD